LAEARQLAPRAPRAVALAMAVVVAGFIASLWASHRPLARIGNHAEGITANASPSIERLAAARSALLSLGAGAGEAALLSRAVSSEIDGRLEGARQALEKAISDYLALPSSGDERERTAALPRELRMLDDALAALQRASGGVPADRAGAWRALQSRLDSLDRSLRALVELNAAEAAREAAQIQEARHRARELALLFGAISVAAAIVATLLAAQAMRMQQRLGLERNRLLEERALELEAFAGRVAHDLRNPLNAMALRAAALRHSSGEGAAAEAVPKLEAQIARMSRIIDGLLEFAQAGARPGPGQRASLAHVLADAVSDELDAARAGGIELRIERVPDVEVACAPGALTSVATNLLRNAVKYVVDGSGAPRVTVRARERAGRVRVEVEDNGPGIPGPDRERVFEPFARATTQQPGMGLGLAMVKRIVEAYGGAVGVESTPGCGCCFWFELPCAPPTAAPAGGAPPPGAAAAS
jgi:signal transduction histidine kinase